MGAARHGGRWNGPGAALVYTSASPSLAALERLVHTFSVPGLAAVWIYGFSFEEEESLYLPGDELPKDWNRKPTPPDWHTPPLKATQFIGNDWLMRRASLLLRVPSTIVPGEYNYLVNPAHPSFGASKIDSPKRFNFDERLTNLVEAYEQKS